MAKCMKCGGPTKMKKMQKGGAKKSSVPTPGMAYKQKGIANQMAMATGIPAGSKSVKPKAKTSAKPVAKTIPGKTLTKLPEVTITAKRKTSAPVAKKPASTTPVKTTPKVTKLPEVTVTAKKKELTVTPKAKTVTKPASGSATNTSGGKTVAQMWQEKTGTSWSEAKKQGLTDGSAKANMKLMADMKANAGNYSKRSTETAPEKLAPISASKAAESLSSSRTTPELAKSTTPTKTEKESLGARIKSKIGQMKKGGMVKKKK